MKFAPDTGLPRERLSHFRVTTDLCPQALLRILGLVAQNSLIPRTVACERGDNQLHIALALDGLAPQRADILLAKISTIVTVRHASLTSADMDAPQPPA